MSSGIPENRRQAVRSRTEDLRLAINDLDLVAAGTLSRRMKRCGRSNCQCASDPTARHGPYFEWTRMKDGKFVNTLVSAEQAALLEIAIANYRRLQELLKRWHEVSEADILEKSGTAGPKINEK
jgi:hypothetical protein